MFHSWLQGQNKCMIASLFQRHLLLPFKMHIFLQLALTDGSWMSLVTCDTLLMGTRPIASIPCKKEMLRCFDLSVTRKLSRIGVYAS